jgi:hypothetical protein
MSERDGFLWNSLEKWSATLFLVAGGVLVVFAALLGVEAFTDRTFPTDIFGPGGFAIAFVGLLGLYPRLADESPWLARVGAVTGPIAAVGAAVTSVWYMGVAMGMFPGDPAPAYIGVFFIGIFIGFLLEFPSFALATLRTDVHSRTLGFLLLAPTIPFVAMLVLLPITGGTAVGAFILDSGEALAMLAIGYTLRTENARSSRLTHPSTVR